MSETGPTPSKLDRPAARLTAVGIALLCAVALGYIHRDDLFPAEDGMAEAGDDPVLLCLAERAADIDRMVADGILDAARSTLFKSRAEALCQSTVGGGNSGPPKQ